MDREQLSCTRRVPRFGFCSVFRSGEMASAGVLAESRPDGILANTAASAVWIYCLSLTGNNRVKWRTVSEHQAHFAPA